MKVLRRIIPIVILLAIPLFALNGEESAPSRSSASLTFLLYPVAVSVGLGLYFLFSLISGHPVAERFARREEPELSPLAIRYCRGVTQLWVIFFICNGAAALALALRGSLAAWFFYNGVLSYIIIALIFLVESIVRRRVKRRSHEAN